MEDIRYDATLDFRIHNVGFVSVLRNENFTFEYKTGKERFSFIYVKKGKMQYSFPKEKKKITIEKDDFLFVPKSIPYKSVYLADNTIIKIIVFDIDTKRLPDYLKIPFSKRSPHIKNLFDALTLEHTNSAFYLTSKIYEILYYMLNENINTPKKYQKILPAITHINKNYTQSNKLSYYAELCNMSESNFRKLFKEYTGKSPIEYRIDQRIEYAKKLLNTGEMTAFEVALECGFDDPAYFCRVFKKQTGVTAGEYLKGL